jgi:hypothetical protein
MHTHIYTETHTLIFTITNLSTYQYHKKNVS